MIALSRDAAWVARLESLALRSGWSFEARGVLPAQTGLESSLVLVDRELAGTPVSRTLSSLRGLSPGAALVLVCADAALDAAAATALVSSGADDVLFKSWDEPRLAAKLSALHELGLGVRTSADGRLWLDRRSHRASLRAGGAWRELALDAAAFALLWRLLAREGELVSRAELLMALREAVGRELQPSSVARRVASLKRAVAAWPGKLETVRGGGYRLHS